jgi:DNA-binding transcriptional LysR family regulator
VTAAGPTKVGPPRQPSVVVPDPGRYVPRVDFDLAQVRAFTAVADQLHFGRAAAALQLTQQALSRRIQRLEKLLGVELFVRDSGGVVLTEAGRRFQPHAQQLLAVADLAVAGARAAVERPLRVDVWGAMRLGPHRFVERLMATEPTLPLEPSMRHSVRSAAEALLRGDLDVAFGRVHDLDEPLPGALRQRLVMLEPVAALVGAEHPLGDAPALSPFELQHSVLSCLPPGTAPEGLRWYERLSDDFGIPLRHRPLWMLPPLDELAGEAAAQPELCWIMPAATTVDVSGLRLVPLRRPLPRWPWSVIWRRDDRGPLLARFLHRLSETARAEGWRSYDPKADWVPAPDRADLPSA